MGVPLHGEGRVPLPGRLGGLGSVVSSSVVGSGADKIWSP